MSGNELPPPSPFDAPTAPSPWAPEASPTLPSLPTPPSVDPAPPTSPWARPADGQQPAEFDVRPLGQPASALPAHRAIGKVVGVVAVVAVVVAGAVLFAVRGNDESDEVATSAQVVSGSVPATTLTGATAPDADDPVEPTGPTAGTPAADAYSWEALASQPQGPQRLVMSVGAMGDVMYEIAVETDASKRMHMTMEGVGQSFEMVVDLEDGAAYLSGLGVEDLTTAGAEWIQVDLESVIELTGMDYQQFLDSFDLAAEVAPFEGIGEPESRGLTEIDGETLMLYTLAIDADEFAALAEAEPGLMDNPMLGELTDGTSAEYRVYVTEDSRLRRLEMAMDVFGEEMTTTMTVLPADPDFVVTLPDPAEVEELDLSQFGQLG
jgi:hypothetical protein